MTSRRSQPEEPRLSIGQCATLACLLEVSAPKPGNVNRGADFADLTLEDFLTAAVAVAPAMEAANSQRLGKTVLDAIRATRALVNTNVNLGAVLLIAPLAKVPRNRSLRPGVARVLDDLLAEDARDVYAAIRLAQPGAMGKVPRYDIGGPPPEDLLTAMKAAAAHDRVARQYSEGFVQLFEQIIPWLQKSIERTSRLPEAIVDAQLHVLAEFPDSLIARKAGIQVANEASARAAAILGAGTPGSPGYVAGLADLDFWMRSDHQRRNPGTTADLLAAALFALLREGELLLAPDETSGPAFV